MTSSTNDNIGEQIVELDKKDIGSKIKNFSDLLQSIDNMDDKKKKLWKEIYENAVIDRQNAFAMFKLLTKIVGDKSIEHGVHARSMSGYIERMSKSNDQLIKLAQLIATEQTKADVIDSNDIYDKINGK